MRKIKKILVVDDEPVIQIDLSQQLTDLGYTVVGHASDGFDAVERCQEHYPDIVLMDIKMPIFDGFGATETILQRGLSSCVVMLTAYYSADYIERAKQVVQAVTYSNPSIIEPFMPLWRWPMPRASVCSRVTPIPSNCGEK